MNSALLRKTVEQAYQLKRDKLSPKKEYTCLIYRGSNCIAKFKTLLDAEICIKALVESHLASLVKELKCDEPSIDVRTSS